MAAALTSFHDFLVKWFDTPPLPRSLHSDIPSPEVRAVVIWDHQVHLAQAWIQHISQDVLLRTALQVALAISAEQPSRVKEVLFLKLGNVHDFGEWIEIEIAPRWRKDGLKTTASQRRLTIIHPARMLTIRDWVRAKKTAGLGQRALLFCGPHDHQSIYRRSDMNRALNKLLRAVSGEPKAVTHSMRHAGVSRQAEPVLASSSRPGIDRWRALAAESGHATPVTTLGVYTNLYESPLRQWLTVAVLRQLPLTSHEIAVLSGFDPAALRQRASRAGLSSVEFAWRACAYPMPPSGLPDAATAFDMVLPQSPMPLDSIAPELTPGVTLLLLERLAAGQSPSQVAADFMLAVKVVECLDELARALALELAKSFWPRRSARTGVPLELPSALDLLRLHVADASHPKLAPLRQYLLLNPTDETLLGRAAESWLICRRGEYLAVDSPRAIVDLYRLLLTSGMNPAAVRLCLRDASRGSSNVELASRVCTDFLSVFGVKPSIFDAAARERVPQAYVQLDQADGEASTGRGGSIGGLDVLMFAVLAHLRWISREAQ